MNDELPEGHNGATDITSTTDVAPQNAPLGPPRPTGQLEGTQVDMKRGIVHRRKSSDALGAVPLHRDDNVPVTLQERRDYLLTTADPEQDGAFYKRLAPQERDAQCTKTLLDIKQNGNEFFTAKFFNCTLGPEGAIRLRNALENNSHLRKLYVTGTRLGPVGCTTLCKALVANPSLTKIDIQCNRIGIDGGIVMGELLLSNNILIDLNLAGNEIEDKGCEAICSALIFNRKSRLSILNIGNNRITLAGSHIAKLIRSTKGLRALYCWRNRLGNRDRSTGMSSFWHIASAIPFSTSICFFDFTFNNIQPMDASILMDTIAANRDKFENQTEPKILKIIEGNLIPEFLIPRIASVYALCRLPMLDPSEPASQVPKNADPQTRQIVKNITVDRSKIEGGATTMQLTLNLKRNESSNEMINDTAPPPSQPQQSSKKETRFFGRECGFSSAQVDGEKPRKDVE